MNKLKIKSKKHDRANQYFSVKSCLIIGVHVDSDTPETEHSMKVQKRCYALVFPLLWCYNNVVTLGWENMLFSWDDNKDRSNKKKHGVSFETAKHVFDDPLHVSKQDQIVDGEARWKTIGVVEGVVILLVAHTVDDTEGNEQVRIISARQASKQERLIYEQENI